MEHSNQYSEWMLITLVSWFCLMPLLLFIIIPIWGNGIGLAVASFLLVSLLGLCWLLCMRPRH